MAAVVFTGILFLLCSSCDTVLAQVSVTPGNSTVSASPNGTTQAAPTTSASSSVVIGTNSTAPMASTTMITLPVTSPAVSPTPNQTSPFSPTALPTSLNQVSSSSLNQISSTSLLSSVMAPPPSSQVTTSSRVLDSSDQLSTLQPGTTSSVVMIIMKPGPDESSGSDDSVVYPIVGALAAALGIVLIIVIVVIVIMMMKRRRNKYPNTVFSNKDLTDDQTDTAATGTDTLGLDGISERQTKPSILIGEFSEHVMRLHRDADRGFEEEYWTLPDKPLMLYTSAKLRCNRVKNRFDNVFPYDNSRVKLSPLPGLEGSDYINASFLDGYNKENAYIAAQGPLKGTVGDFWRMVWEYKLFTIIMLTETVEAGRDKCEQYWPSSINESWNVGGSLTVTLVEQRPYAEYKVKILTVEDLSQPEPCPFTVTHYHFSAWPDHGVPADKTCLIHFIQRVRKAHPYENSISLLVHCSAGVGRTGTFMVLDSMLQRMKTETSLNIYEFLYQLRTKRILMVQTPIQYSFIHDALEEFITCGDTSIAVSSIRTAVEKLDGDTKTSYTEQFQLLNEVAYKADAVNCSYGETEENKEKNRYHDKIPYNQTRVILRGTAVKGSDYINASFVDGYKQRRAYIATQAPLESTANDFWRMMWEHKSRTIVMLCDLTEDDSESSYQYWPTDTENPVVYGKLKVEMTSEDTSGELTTRKFELTQDNPSPMTGAPKSAVITQFHHTAWPKGGQQLSSSPVLKLINALIKTQMTTGNHSITVMCNDGVGRTGCFICVYSELEKIKVEGITDVFQYIKASRFQRPGLVSTVEQYKFCHTVLVDFVDTFDNYANFKVL